MDPDHVAAQVRERSGIDVQAVTLVRSGNGEETMPSVWAAMTELGHFWAVENGETLELFRAVPRKRPSTDLTSCHSAVEAARRFLELHPPAPTARPTPRASMVHRATRRAKAAADSTEPAAHPDDDRLPADGRLSCQACGAALSSRAIAARTRSGGSGRALCSRCRHAAHERLRYQQDPSYRARRLAYSAARYRRAQQAAGEQN